MAASYPAIPLPQRVNNLSIAPIVTEKPVLGGRALRQRISKKYRVTLDAEWLFSESEFNTWALFVQNTIAFNGEFAMTCFGPDGIAERNVYLVGGKYDYVPIGNGPIKVNASVRWDQGPFIATCVVNVVDGGDTSSTHTDVYDGGDTSSTHTNILDGGTS